MRQKYYQGVNNSMEFNIFDLKMHQRHHDGEKDLEPVAPVESRILA